MISIKDMSVSELKEHIRDNEEILDMYESTQGDIGNALAEIAVAKRELRRKLNRNMGR